jgi:hypothetical protein
MARDRAAWADSVAWEPVQEMEDEAMAMGPAVVAARALGSVPVTGQGNSYLRRATFLEAARLVCYLSILAFPVSAST